MSAHTLMVDRVEPGGQPHEAEAESVTVLTWPMGEVELVLDDGLRLILDPDAADELRQALAAQRREVEAA